jgi:hypothetical protein
MKETKKYIEVRWGNLLKFSHMKDRESHRKIMKWDFKKQAVRIVNLTVLTQEQIHWQDITAVEFWGFYYQTAGYFVMVMTTKITMTVIRIVSATNY